MVWVDALYLGTLSILGLLTGPQASHQPLCFRGWTSIAPKLLSHDLPIQRPVHDGKGECLHQTGFERGLEVGDGLASVSPELGLSGCPAP